MQHIYNQDATGCIVQGWDVRGTIPPFEYAVEQLTLTKKDSHPTMTMRKVRVS